MFAPLVVPALAAALWIQAPGDHALAAVRLATQAVEGDSVDAVRARWVAAGAPPRSDRIARLGLGMLSYLTYDLDGAAATLRALVSPAGGSADAVSVRARIGLAQVARSRADFLTAERMLVEARDEAERIGETDAATEALLVLAMTTSRTQGPEAAELLFAQARPRVNADARLGALYHCARADLLVLGARPARESADLGAELASRAGAGRLHAACLAARASDRAREGDIEGALADMQDSADMRRALRDYIGLAVALQWRGYWLRSVGRLEQARLALEDALVAARIAGASSPLAWSYTNLAYIDLSLGDATSGLVHADSAALLAAVQGDRYGEGTIQGVLGDLAAVARDPEGARQAYDRSVEILEPLGFRMGLVSARVGLAHVAMAEGAWDEAERQLRLAARAAGGGATGEPGTALAYHRGVLALRRGRLDEAEAELSRGVRLLGGGAEGQPVWIYHYRMRLAEISAARGDLVGALRSTESAMDALETWRSSLSLPELRLLAFQVSEDRSDPDLGFASIVAALVEGGLVDQAFLLAEKLRDRSHRDQLTRIESLGAENREAGGHGEPSGLQVQGARELMAVLPGPETAVLAWVTGLGGEPTTLFAVDASGLRAQLLPPADSLEPAVRRLVAAVESGDPLPRALVERVSRAVLGDASHLVSEEVKHLVLIPDGPVHLVPFDLLAVGRDTTFVERFSFTVQSSAAAAAQAWASPAPPAAGSVLALGAPMLEGAAASGLPTLPGARREARRAASYGTGSTSLTGADASEVRVKSLAPGRYGLIHFATHARLDEATLAGAVLLLAPGGGDDGVLRAGEIAQLDLDVGVAILSACSTAEGRIVRGEGLIGLASALREAGVRAVVLTRWRVSDEAEGELIDGLYAGLADGLTVANAVRAAKLRMRARGAPSSVWASLAVAGDGSVTLPLHAPRSSGGSLFGMVAAALLLAAAGAAVVRRRAGAAC